MTALHGSIRVPSDKSLSHRAVLMSALAEGTSHLSGVLDSDDVRSTVAAVRALGADVSLAPGEGGLAGEVRGIGAPPRLAAPHRPAAPPQHVSEIPFCSFAGGAADAGGDAAGSEGTAATPAPSRTLEIDCGNSGTTARLLMGVVAGLGADAVFTGDESLSTRPMERVMGPLRLMGARFECEGGHLPVHVVGRGAAASGGARGAAGAPGAAAGGTDGTDGALHGVSYASPQASAQVKSAVLLAGLYAEGTTSVTEPARSRDHTERLLPLFGAEVDVSGDGLTSRVRGGQRLFAHDVEVPGDPSSAAFVAVAAALAEGSSVRICGVAVNPTRAGAFEVLAEMGADVSYADERLVGAEPVADVVVEFSPELRAVRVAADRVPTLVDEVCVLSLAAAAADGESVFCGVGELRVKESDRLAAVTEGLGRLGVRAWAAGDDLHIAGTGSPAALAGSLRGKRVAFETRHDHRLAMTWGTAALALGFEAVLDDAECVSVSWPGFETDLASLV